MPNGPPPADGTCFAAHYYAQRSSEIKKKQKARATAREYRANRVRYVNCALSLEEYAELKKKTGNAGYAPTAYLRKTAFTHFRGETLWPKDVDTCVGELVALMRNIASNLNQIARRTNQTTRLSFFDALQARKTVLDLETAIKAFLDNPFSR